MLHATQESGYSRRRFEIFEAKNHKNPSPSFNQRHLIKPSRSFRLRSSISIFQLLSMAVVVSAPGKVLMTGGYLILDRPHAGLVLSTNARFFAIVKPFHEHIPPNSWAWVWTDVKLTSPQLARETMYKLSLKKLALQCTSQSDKRSPFVEHSVQYTIAAAYAMFDETKKQILRDLLLKGLDITILGCNDFYSYRDQIEASGLPLGPESLASLPPFASITFNAEESTGHIHKPEVAKTGLGSSAAMTTAVVAALLQYLGVVNLPSKENQRGDSINLDLVHKIAQSAHCLAQGKVGSGFDISSAVFGSQRYVRFSPEVLSSAQGALGRMAMEEVISDVIKGQWDHERTNFSLPPLMTLLLGEPGAGGSSTVSMVGAVRKWKKSQPESYIETWKNLPEANALLESQLNLLSVLAAESWNEYKSVVEKCSILKPAKWVEQAEPGEEAVVKALLGSRNAMLSIRHYMRFMGEAAGIPIEPKSQTQLLDATMNMEGVLFAGVPGAGGFDAVFAVTLGDSASSVSKNWSSLNVLALLVGEDPQGVCLESGDPRTTEVTSGIASVQIQ